eukprot:1395532-Amorphochlora_amoeboformis.AAC.2
MDTFGSHKVVLSAYSYVTNPGSIPSAILKPISRVDASTNGANAERSLHIVGRLGSSVYQR